MVCEFLNVLVDYSDVEIPYCSIDIGMASLLYEFSNVYHSMKMLCYNIDIGMAFPRCEFLCVL